MSAAPPTLEQTGDSSLLAEIRREIRERGPLSFSRFQDLALYHPALGYYTRRAAIGREGADFWTAPEMDPVFGELLGAQIREMFDLLGQPEEFRLIEIGGGTGRLAESILTAWRSQDAPLYRAGVYRMVESSPVLAGKQRDLLARHPGMVQWDARDEEEISPASPGVILMNEVLDALPVDRVVRQGGIIREICIGLDGEALVEVRRPARAELAETLERRLPAGVQGLEEGQEAEVCLVLGPFLGRTLDHIQRGYLLAIDYGMRAAELYHPSRRRGTLMAYHRHQASEDVLQRVGHQDLTAHVDWSAVKDLAGERGLHEIGLTTQMRFLLALGLSDRIQQLERGDMDDGRRAQRRLSMAALIRPGGMGEMFKVWIGARQAPELVRGLVDPFAGGTTASNRAPD